MYYQTNNNNTGNGNANAAAAAQGGASFLIAIILLCIFYVIYCITYICGKYVSKFISIFTLMLTNASIFSVCVYLRFKNMYFLIGLISWFAAVINFFGIVLPCCCLKLSNLYDDPEFERLSKLRVKQSQKEEPFVEKVYQVPQEVLRDTITESSAPIDNNQKKEYENNNDEGDDINLIQPGNQEENIIDINQNPEIHNKIDNNNNDNDNENDFNLIESGSQEPDIININQKQECDNNIDIIDNGNDYNLIEHVHQEQDNININNAQINNP